MTIEHEAGRIPKAGLSKEFLNRVLRLERNSSLPTWEELPDSFCLPENWVGIISKLVNKTIQENREAGVVGYLSRHRFQPHEITFGKLVLGTRESVALNIKRKKFPLSFFSPSSAPVIEIHTHPAYRLKEKLASGLEIFENPIWQDPSRGNLSAVSQIPSGKDLARFLYSPKTLLGFVVLPRNDGKTDIDVLVKCQETDLIRSMERQEQVMSNFDVAFGKFVEKTTQGYGHHLVDWKTFFGTVARTYKVGYYSSYNCSSAARQELSSRQPIRLMQAPSFDLLDAFLASPMFLSAKLK